MYAEAYQIMTERLDVRPVAGDDVAEIKRLTKECLFDIAGSLEPELFNILVSKIDWELAHYPDTSLVAYQNGQQVGFSFTEYAEEDAFIVFLAVRPDSRRRGVGKALVTKTLRLLKEKGVRFVEVMTVEENSTAQRFWASQGFTDFKMKVLAKRL
jgi:ribosomal protein S18 acetylase RimI-like enzyme